MLGWLKDKLSAGWQSSEVTQAAEHLRTQFEPLEKIPGGKQGLAERLTRYVFTGEEKAALSDLASMHNTQFILSNPSTFYSPHNRHVKDLPSLVKLLPHDPDLYLRLADVYDAVNQPGSGASFISGLIPIPAFQGSLSWLSSFLVELSQGGHHREPYFSVNLLTQMITARGDDPNVLVKGPFFSEASQASGPLGRLINPPPFYFHCLQGFSELVLSSPDTVRPAFQQKDASSRAGALRALITLKIAPDTFAEEIASLAVSGSKEVREAAQQLVADRAALFQPFLAQQAA